MENDLSTLKQLILDKTQGTPFFMEEIVQELKEQGVLRHEASAGWVATQPTTALQIPTTVQAVLAARIDRLDAAEKALLQQLAVIGRQFPLSLIRQVIAQPEVELYRLLASLQHKEFLYEQPAFPESEYIFKHALTQEVAYGTVLQEQRKALHERTGQALETVYAATLSEHYSDLAHHFSRSGNTEKAVEYLGLAGQQAVQRSANVEAVNHFTAAITLLQTLPDTLERRQQELSLHVALGAPLTAIKSWAAPEMEQVYIRARELCEEMGDTPELFRVLWGLWAFHHVRADYQAACALGEDLLHLAKREHDPALLVEAHFALGLTLYFRGEFEVTRRHCEQSVAHYDAQQQSSLVTEYGFDPAMSALDYEALALWFLGYPAQALRQSQASLDIAYRLAHPFTLAYALDNGAIPYLHRREWDHAHARADASVALATEHGFPFWVATSSILRGRAVVERGSVADGIAQIQWGIAAGRDIGAEVYQSYYLSLLAEAYQKNGQVEEGLAAVTEALAFVARTEERFYEAELYRLKGKLTLERNVQSPESRTKEAEACFLKALAIAQRQQAKSLELRAVMSLARLWQQRGKTKEARELLAPVYTWFTEGFDTKDLQEAKALLETLS